MTGPVAPCSLFILYGKIAYFSALNNLSMSMWVHKVYKYNATHVNESHCK